MVAKQKSGYHAKVVKQYDRRSHIGEPDIGLDMAGRKKTGQRSFRRQNRTTHSLWFATNMLVFKILFFLAAAFYLFGVWAWTAGALYYDAGQRSGWGWLWVLLWTTLCLALLVCIHPFWIPLVWISFMVAGVVGWWLTLKPSHDRTWDQNFSQLPRMTIKDDTLTVHEMRNTEYRSLEDYDCHYEDRQYKLSKLCGIDFLMLFWGSEFMSHPMAVFDFGNDQHLCISIEVRYRLNESYSVMRSIYRQNELMYVVCDERDAILRRTMYSENHDVYLYRLQLREEELRIILDDYIRQINKIYERPRWYNVITANCTTSIYRQLTHQPNWNWRMLVNGQLDRMMYQRGTFFQGLPFDELKTRCWINRRANEAQRDSFSREIRQGLPGF